VERSAARTLLPLSRPRDTSTPGLRPARDIIAWRLQIADDDTVDVARRRWKTAIVPLFIEDDGPDLAEGHAHCSAT